MTAPGQDLWTPADIAAHCKRYGLSISAPLMQRMHELSGNVSRTGMAIPRMPVKNSEPALVFTMPNE